MDQGIRRPQLQSLLEGGDGFVEVDAARLCAVPRTLIRFESAAGGHMVIELGVEMPLDVVALARAFWDRRG